MTFDCLSSLYLPLLSFALRYSFCLFVYCSCGGWDLSYQLHRHGTVINIHSVTPRPNPSSSKSESYEYYRDGSETAHKRLRMNPPVVYSSSSSSSSSMPASTAHGIHHYHPNNPINPIKSIGSNAIYQSSGANATSFSSSGGGAGFGTGFGTTDNTTTTTNAHTKRSRDEIEALAQSMGAKGG